MIAVIDYGLGNLRSVTKALELVIAASKSKAGPVEIVSRPDLLRCADAAVLPGVGAFKRGIHNIEGRGLLGPIREFAASGKPFLGICLGLQMLFSESDEEGLHEGLHIIEGRVVRLKGGLKIPHMGWNTVRFASEKANGDNGIFRGIPDNSYFYFVHSYHGVPADMNWAAGLTEYGETTVSACQRDNVWAVQFHPEKSAALGLKILENFCGSINSPPRATSRGSHVG